MEENLNAVKDFIGFYQLENIKSSTIVHVIKDNLIIINLSLSNCRGQACDEVSNMMGKKSEVLTEILAEQLKAFAIHCQGHSLTLSVKSMTKECDILQDVMSVVGEICILMKFSPEREHVLGNISGNIEKEDSETFKKLKRLSATR